jgi:hypothetical protein
VRVRFGYRRLTVLLRREGWRVNAKRIYRLYGDAGLENAFIESFKGRLRDECLNAHVFASTVEAQRVLEAWRLDYSHVAHIAAWQIEHLPRWAQCGSTHVTQRHADRLIPILDGMITGGALVTVERVRVLKYAASRKARAEPTHPI